LSHTAPPVDAPFNAAPEKFADSNKAYWKFAWVSDDDSKFAPVRSE
jgi:hypothetical protein